MLFGYYDVSWAVLRLCFCECVYLDFFHVHSSSIMVCISAPTAGCYNMSYPSTVTQVGVAGTFFDAYAFGGMQNGVRSVDR